MSKILMENKLESSIIQDAASGYFTLDDTLQIAISRNTRVEVFHMQQEFVVFDHKYSVNAKISKVICMKKKEHKLDCLGLILDGNKIVILLWDEIEFSIIKAIDLTTTDNNLFTNTPFLFDYSPSFNIFAFYNFNDNFNIFFNSKKLSNQEIFDVQVNRSIKKFKIISIFKFLIYLSTSNLGIELKSKTSNYKVDLSNKITIIMLYKKDEILKNNEESTNIPLKNLILNQDLNSNQVNSSTNDVVTICKTKLYLGTFCFSLNNTNDNENNDNKNVNDVELIEEIILPLNNIYDFIYIPTNACFVLFGRHSILVYNKQKKIINMISFNIVDIIEFNGNDTSNKLNKFNGYDLTFELSNSIDDIIEGGNFQLISENKGFSFLIISYSGFIFNLKFIADKFYITKLSNESIGIANDLIVPISNLEYFVAGKNVNGKYLKISNNYETLEFTNVIDNLSPVISSFYNPITNQYFFSSGLDKSSSYNFLYKKLIFNKLKLTEINKSDEVSFMSVVNELIIIIYNNNSVDLFKINKDSTISYLNDEKKALNQTLSDIGSNKIFNYVKISLINKEPILIILCSKSILFISLTTYKLINEFMINSIFESFGISEEVKICNFDTSMMSDINRENSDSDSISDENENDLFGRNSIFLLINSYVYQFVYILNPETSELQYKIIDLSLLLNSKNEKIFKMSLLKINNEDSKNSNFDSNSLVISLILGSEFHKDLIKMIIIEVNNYRHYLNTCNELKTSEKIQFYKLDQNGLKANVLFKNHFISEIPCLLTSNFKFLNDAYNNGDNINLNISSKEKNEIIEQLNYYSNLLGLVRYNTDLSQINVENEKDSNNDNLLKNKINEKNENNRIIKDDILNAIKSKLSTYPQVKNFLDESESLQGFLPEYFSMHSLNGKVIIILISVEKRLLKIYEMLKIKENKENLIRKFNLLNNSNFDTKEDGNQTNHTKDFDNNFCFKLIFTENFTTQSLNAEIVEKTILIDKKPNKVILVKFPNDPKIIYNIKNQIHVIDIDNKNIEDFHFYNNYYIVLEKGLIYFSDFPTDYNLSEFGLLKRNNISKTPFITESYNLFMLFYALKTNLYELYVSIEKTIDIINKSEQYYLSIRKDDE